MIEQENLLDRIGFYDKAPSYDYLKNIAKERACFLWKEAGSPKSGPEEFLLEAEEQLFKGYDDGYVIGFCDRSLLKNKKLHHWKLVDIANIGAKMDQIYEKNGLIFWTEKEINLREMMMSHFSEAVKTCLKSQNKAWEFVRTEAPLLTPRHLINKNYTNDDVYEVDENLVLRPETTMGSYSIAKHLFGSHNKINPPLCVWQYGKSFRKEQDQSTKFMRLKEFYQLEFQNIYSKSTKKDYSEELIPVVKKSIEEMIGPCKVEDSDRLPDYAEWTRDVVCKLTNMEVCSISLRKDFEEYFVLEVAIGMDRCVFNFSKKL